jgi:3-oxoacyl-ACP reductase-like protein
VTRLVSDAPESPATTAPPAAAPPAPLTAAAPAAKPPSPDEIYEEVVRRLRRDLIVEREQRGELW